MAMDMLPARAMDMLPPTPTCTSSASVSPPPPRPAAGQPPPIVPPLNDGYEREQALAEAADEALELDSDHATCTLKVRPSPVLTPPPSPAPQRRNACQS